jgi:tricorn protease-like protein
MKKLCFPILILSVLIISCSNDTVQNTGINNNLTSAGEIYFVKRKPTQSIYSTYAINSDGSGRKLINDTLMITSPSYSGKITLAKLNNTGEYFERLYVADTISNHLVSIPRNYYYPVYYLIAPGGYEILFSCINEYLCVVKADGTGLLEISSGIGGTERIPKFSPDGKKIAFFESTASSPQGLYIINSNGTNKKLVMDSINYNQAAMLDWSPDGNKIVFENSNGPVTNICVIDTSGNNYLVLSEGKNPSWSKDGSKIAFLKDVNQGREDVYIINADGTDPLNISNTPSNFENEPYWSPSDKMSVLYITSTGFYGKLKIYDVSLQNTSILSDSVTWGFWKY